MSRTRKSAKQAGTRFERSMADYFARVLGDADIDRQIKTGSKDKGDIRGLYFRGQPLTLECKNCARMELPQWLREAEVEAGNADSELWAVCHKRKGIADPAEQYVTMTARTLAAMIAGHPGLLEEE